MVKNLIIAIGICFLLQMFGYSQSLSFLFLQVLCQFDGCSLGVATIWQIVTYSFFHGSSFHFLFNMYAIWLFGNHCEVFYGGKYFLAVYFISVVTAALSHIIVSAVSGANTVVIGASGGVFGIMMLFALTFPQLQLRLLLPPITVSARTLVIVFAAIELVSGVSGFLSSVAHFAHLGGLLGGYLCYRYRADIIRLIN